jgi:hypothetical protein
MAVWTYKCLTLPNVFTFQIPLPLSESPKHDSESLDPLDSILDDLLDHPDLLTLSTFYVFLDRTNQQHIPALSDLHIATFLIHLAQTSPDESVIGASLKCLSLWPYALSAMSGELVSSGYPDLLLHFLCGPSRAYDLHLLCGLKNLIQYYPPFRDIFPLKFPIEIVFETFTTVSSLLCIEAAGCFDQIVLRTEICEKTAEYCMKAFSLVLMQRFQRAANFDYSIALHGILTLLRSTQLDHSFRARLAVDHLVAFLTRQFLIGQSVSPEKVYAAMITAQLCTMEVPDIGVAHRAILEILKQEHMAANYSDIIAGLTDIIGNSSDSVRVFLEQELIPALVAVIPRAPYSAREALVRCVFVAVKRVDLGAVAPTLAGGFVELVFNLLEAEDRPAFLEFIIVEVCGMIEEAIRLGLEELLAVMKSCASEDLRENLSCHESLVELATSFSEFFWPGDYQSESLHGG